jgi:hypothetical protein
MQDIVDKILELRKALGAMKPKDHDVLVPALSLPSIKSLSISSTSASSKPAKLPGVTAASGKDPKKMAEQLKNPRPKKPKVEMLKADEEPKYRIHVDGNPVTEPMPLHHIVAKHGPIKNIESQPGHRVIPMKMPTVLKADSNGQWSLDKFGENNSV